MHKTLNQNNDILQTIFFKRYFLFYLFDVFKYNVNFRWIQLIIEKKNLSLRIAPIYLRKYTYASTFNWFECARSWFPLKSIFLSKMVNFKCLHTWFNASTHSVEKRYPSKVYICMQCQSCFTAKAHLFRHDDINQPMANNMIGIAFRPKQEDGPEYTDNAT